MSIIEKYFKMICEIQYYNKIKVIIKDCCSEEVENLCKYKHIIFAKYCDKNSYNKKLVNLYKNSIDDFKNNDDLKRMKNEREGYRPSIWILNIISNNDNEDIVQVGSNKNIFSSFENDIGPAITAIINKNSSNKYYALTNMNEIETISFHELDVNTFLKNFVRICMDNNIWGDFDSQVQYLLEYNQESNAMQYAINTSKDLLFRGCIEGLIACISEKKCNKSYWKWSESPDGIDGWFYNYFKEKLIHIDIIEKLENEE